jgi:serine/threonine protein kinase
LHSFSKSFVQSLNILVSDDYSAKLCDFGLSKTTSGSSLNSCVGSLNWCAPEVLLRNDPFTKYADVYSMGMVLLELYTHNPPFAGMLPLQIVKAIDSGTLLPIPPACPRAYGLLIRHCWDYTPKNRPSFAVLEKELASLSPAIFPVNSK